jgi:hypothetical protein
MAGIEDLKKGMSKIADDEYYASLQKFLERDPGAREYLNPDDITYPAMDKSANYNYKGFQLRTKDPEFVEEYMEQRDIDKIYSPKSTYMEKIKKGKYPVAILEEPVKTGNEPGDLFKISTILHEARHKIMMEPKFKDIINKYGIEEETFVRFLDKEFFPELDAYIPKFKYPEEAYKIYGKAVKEYKDKFGKEEKGILNSIKDFFKSDEKKSSNVDKPLSDISGFTARPKK